MSECHDRKQRRSDIPSDRVEETSLLENVEHALALAIPDLGISLLPLLFSVFGSGLVFPSNGPFLGGCDGRVDGLAGMA